MKNKFLLTFLVAATVGATSLFLSYQSGTVLRVEFDAKPSKVSSLNTPGQVYGLVFAQIYETLFVLKANGNLSPQLVENWNSNDDFTEFNFMIKKGVKFHNGKTLTPSDVVSSLKYVKNNPPDGNFTQVLNKIEKIELVDNKVMIKLKESYFEFLYFLASPITKILPGNNSSEKEVYEREWVGTGAFRLQQLTSDSIILERFNEYREDIKLDRVVFKNTNDPKLGLDNDELDMIYIPRKKVDEYRTHPEYKVVSTPMLGSFWIGFNMKRGQMRDLNLRKTIYHLINRATIVEGVVIPPQLIPESIIPYGILGYKATNKKHSLDEAKSYFSKVKTKSKKIKILIHNKMHKMGNYAIGKLRESLFNVGLELEVVKTPINLKDRGVVGNYYQYLRDHPSEFDLYIRGMVSPLASADHIIKETFLKSGKMNFGNYYNLELEKKLKDKPKGILESEIQEYYSSIIEIISSDYAVIPLGNLFSNKLLKANSKYKFNGVTPYVTLFKDSLN